MKSSFLSDSIFRQIQNVGLRTMIYTLGSVLLLLLILPICFMTVQGASDFSTLDGDDTVIMSDKFFLRKEYSLTQPYHGPWDLGGSAVITSDFIRLTPDSQSHRGAIWSRIPVHIRHWEVHLNFRIHGSDGRHYGDGLAFWYVHPRTTFPGGAFGGKEKFRGLGVFLDTYSNAQGPRGPFHPYISAVVNNGSVKFDHEADGEQRAPVGCTRNFRNRKHETLIAIRYVDEVLTVSTDIENRNTWQHCFRARGVRLPTHFVFGLSAMTGDLSDNHDVISMKVYEVESAIEPDDYSGNRLIEPAFDIAAYRAKSSSSGGQAADMDDDSSTGLVIVLCLLALICLAAVTALRHYWGRRQWQTKRFY